MITRDDHGYVAPDGRDTANERVKIIDLGIAKSSGAEDNKTKTGMFVGKWKYCSPEHLGMLPAGERIDGRADLYSFGIVLYEMLVGVPPFQADTPHRYLMMHASERPRPLRDVNPGVVELPQLEALIFRALEKDRTRRFATAREFAQELERIAPALPDAPGAPPPVPISAEITDEATREARIAQDAATVLSISGNAPTVATDKTLDRVVVSGATAASAVGGFDGRSGRRSNWIYAAAVILGLMAAGGWMLMRDRPQRPAPKPAPPIEARIAIPVAQGHLGINAFPWAEVTSVKNLENGESVDIGTNVVTPAPLDLAPGRYEVTLTNPNFARPITRTISIAPGTDETLWVSFSDPASASVPDFGVAP
jgi:serine/threonine protein kinase